MYSVGLDIGTSFIKAALTKNSSGKLIDLVLEPSKEQAIISFKDGWAEQDPEVWWNNSCKAIKSLISKNNLNPNDITSLGISYQMHGLVLVDKDGKCLRKSIIWCDDRAVEIGKNAYVRLGEKYCTENLLNSPANFTASKLKWVKENEPEIYSKIHKIMLPGDYIVFKFSEKITTTVCGLSEGIFWDFKKNKISSALLKNFQIPISMIPEIVPSFGFQCNVSLNVKNECGLSENVCINYRAGDQPNNALSLNVLKPGQVAATAGTSGVIYAVTDQLKTSETERINNFMHVSPKKDQLIGKLLCINGAGIEYAKLKTKLDLDSYEIMNLFSEKSPIGSNNLIYLPFGNGSERMLNNKNVGSKLINYDKEKHTNSDLIRATLEGIAFAFVYGMKILIKDGVNPNLIRAGNDNLFQSSVFSETISTVLNIKIELYNTTGAIGASRASNLNVSNLEKFASNVDKNDYFKTYKPRANNYDYTNAYDRWLNELKLVLNKL